MRTVADLADHVRGHRCYSHPVFRHWADVDPAPEVVGALFHQIQHFCASTRPGLAFPDALRGLGKPVGGGSSTRSSRARRTTAPSSPRWRVT